VSGAIERPRRWLRKGLALATVALAAVAVAPLLTPDAGRLVAQAALGGDQPTARAMLQRRLSQRIERVLQLAPKQRERFWAANRRYTQQRIALLERERELRRDLREQLLAASPDEPRVDRLVDGWLQLLRDRLAVAEAEQRELKEFLTPVQRARYFALQEQWRRRVDDLRRRPGVRRDGASDDDAF
jgi:Spy/CpxP family protein refolding chaperone